MALDLSVHYLAGGAASLLPVKLRTNVGLKRLPAFAGFDDFISPTERSARSRPTRRAGDSGESLADERGRSSRPWTWCWIRSGLRARWSPSFHVRMLRRR